MLPALAASVTQTSRHPRYTARPSSAQLPLALLLAFVACLVVRGGHARRVPDGGAPTTAALAEATQLTARAITAYQAGHYDQALPLLEQALRLREAELGQDHPLVAESLNQVATVCTSLGDYARAAPLLQRSLQIHEASLGPKHPAVAGDLVRLARMHQALGAYDLLEPLLERALQIRLAALGSRHPDVARSLISLASLPSRGGVYASPEPLLLEALQIEEAALGPDHPDVAIILHSLAILKERAGEYDHAEALFQRALYIQQAALGPKHPLVASTLTELAQLQMVRRTSERFQPLFLLARRSRYEQRAEALLQRALQIQEETLGVRHPAIAQTLLLLSSLYRSQGSDARAFLLMKRVLALKEDALAAIIPTLTEDRARDMLSAQSGLRDEVLTWAAEPHAASDLRMLAMSTAILLKGRATGELGVSMQALARATKDATNPAIGEHAAQLRALQQQIAALYQRADAATMPLLPERADAPATRLEPLLAQRERLEQQLLRDTTAARRWRNPGAARILAEVAQTLPSDGALLLIEVTRPTFYPMEQTRAVALLLFPDLQVQVVDLGPLAIINKATKELAQQLARVSPDGLAPQAAALRLYQRVMAPLVPRLRGRTRLLLIPDGQLQLVPFAALHDGRDWLLGRYQFNYLTTATSLLQPRAPIAHERSVVIFAPFAAPEAPAVVAVAAAAQRALLESGGPGAALPLLPGTRQEASGIQRLWGGAQLLAGPRASKAALLGTRAPDILHIATHGVFPPGTTPSLVRSALALAPGGGGAAEQGESLVTALEISSMDLSGTQLVVLSACETGMGDVELGEGVAGLRRSFFVAGAETLVTSLWRIADRETQHLMTEYYRRLSAGEGRVAAMDGAAQVIRQRAPHPYYWASFIVLGRGDPLQRLTEGP